ncbi:salicylate synthase [Chamaesiphon polymorphus]|uniref:Salicylate synthase n=1 Tax=Chamaesiphon polymorphus CCALA 037 TaxID=2107692 RepID=A0A2T1G4S1_9CYAN|nr:salicylate synthase [Chamaesiphon polymorphus]PSB52237.1 salicylate synthase [Chamaesiphon polymorphus CCALA 037]
MFSTDTQPLVYHELFVPETKDPQSLLQNLLDIGLFSSYMLYEGDRQTRIAGNTLASIAVSTDTVTLDYLGEIESRSIVGDPLQQVQQMLASLPIENWTAYGYVGFDMARFYSSYSKAIEQPLLYFSIPETELQITEKGIRIKSVKSLTKIIEALAIDAPLRNYTATLPTLDFADREHYQTKVSEMVQAIQAGHLHKAIISRSVKVKGQMDLLGTYRLGTESNNSARSYCFQFDDVSAVGFSPEILMTVDTDRFAITNPLAGTRPRSENLERDEQLSRELFTDAKEVKEHALSIWLAQDEIAALCVPETVRVLDFMEVKQYRCVQHLSSRVGGELQPDKTLWDALKVLFPGITVSGINKQAALEWIDRLETEPRGLYAGGIGWIDSRGTADLAIAIRSAYQYGDTIHFNAGAGIVAESVPEHEYMESVNKMNTMLTNLVLKE